MSNDPKEKNGVTVYVTKYALTKGIFPIRAELIDGGQYASEVGPGIGHFLGRNEYALTEEEAIEQAKKKRDAKIKSLSKKQSQLLAMVFKVRERQ